MTRADDTPIGRAPELRRIVQRLAAERPQSVSVVGDCGIGKSGLLRALHADAIGSAGHAYPAGTVTVLLPLEGDAAADPAGFLAALGHAHESTRPAGAPAMEAPTYDGLHALARRIHDGGGRLILLLDDFNRVTERASFPIEFFAFLRSLASSLSVAYVTTSHVELQRLCVLKEVEQSPFFNIFQNVPLRPLAPADALALAASRLARHGGPAEAAPSIGAVCGGLPLLIDAAARVVAAERRADAAADWLAPRTAEAAADYLSALWTSLSDDERALLESVARGRTLDARQSRTLRELGVRRGYLVPQDGGHAFASAVIERFVRGRVRSPGAPWRRISRALRGRT